MKKEKLEQSKEHLQELLAHTEEAQMDASSHHGSGSGHHHRRHRSRHHSSSGHHHHSGHSHSSHTHHSSDTSRKVPAKINEQELEALMSGENVIEFTSSQNKVHHAQQNIKEGKSFLQQKKSRKRRAGRILLSIFCILLLLTGGTAGTLYYMINRGETLLKQNAGDTRLELLSLNTEDTQIEIETLDDYTLIYQDQKYKYNEDILNFLVVGVDTNGEMENAQTHHGDGSGQADAILLVCMDNHNKKFTLIPVNRDTITSIDIFDKEGNLLNRSREQIALSFAYGDGKAFSAELTKKAVSNLFYGLPVHGYIVVNIDAIPVINDVLGGVEVTLDEDFTSIFGPEFKKGSTVTLNGTEAEKFLRTRSGIGEGNNASRMNQQRQYLRSLIQKAMKETRADLTLPVDVYKILSKYMLTDISSSEIAYLASRAVSFQIPEDFYRSLKGETGRGVIYDEFYLDETALYELILDVFYNKVY